MAFDPNKHRKTQEKLATLQNTKQLVWKIDKPKKTETKDKSKESQTEQKALAK